MYKDEILYNTIERLEKRIKELENRNGYFINGKKSQCKTCKYSKTLLDQHPCLRCGVLSVNHYVSNERNTKD